MRRTFRAADRVTPRVRLSRDRIAASIGMEGLQYFSLGDFPLQSGVTLRGTTLAFRTYGALNAARNNAILIQTFCARTIVMPGTTDLYFRVRDTSSRCNRCRTPELRQIPSSWGHAARRGTNPVDHAFIDHALGELLTCD
ncbi:MAG TPA: hypothetical protein VGH34_10085 [Vicinamibacterales bacterium]